MRWSFMASIALDYEFLDKKKKKVRYKLHLGGMLYAKAVSLLLKHYWNVLLCGRLTLSMDIH